MHDLKPFWIKLPQTMDKQIVSKKLNTSFFWSKMIIFFKKYNETLNTIGNIREKAFDNKLMYKDNV